MAFGKNDHGNIVYAIAKGLHDMGLLSRYLELGIRAGKTFRLIAPLCETAVGVDMELKSVRAISDIRNAQAFHKSTDDFFADYKSGMFDLVFIDACHEHEQSYSDFRNAMYVVRNGGLILLHDTYPPEEKYLSKSYCNDTWKTAVKIKKEYPDFEVCTLPMYCGITVVRVFDKHLVWQA